MISDLLQKLLKKLEQLKQAILLMQEEFTTLELRLNILNEYVDYFVIIEGNKTWQNNFKKLQFDTEKFEKFKNKIIYIPVVDMPNGDNPYLRENFQRNCILRGLEDAKDDDLIIISDLDEIPNPNIQSEFGRLSDTFYLKLKCYF